jgi:hypothetical protein
VEGIFSENIKDLVRGIRVAIVVDELKGRYVRAWYDSHYLWPEKRVVLTGWSLSAGWMVLHDRKLYAIIKLTHALDSIPTYILVRVYYKSRRIEFEGWDDGYLNQIFYKTELVEDEKLAKKIHALFDLGVLYVIGRTTR